MPRALCSSQQPRPQGEEQRLHGTADTNERVAVQVGLTREALSEGTHERRDLLQRGGEVVCAELQRALSHGRRQQSQRFESALGEPSSVVLVELCQRAKLSQRLLLLLSQGSIDHGPAQSTKPCDVCSEGGLLGQQVLQASTQKPVRAGAQETELGDGWELQILGVGFEPLRKGLRLFRCGANVLRVIVLIVVVSSALYHLVSSVVVLRRVVHRAASGALHARRSGRSPKSVPTRRARLWVKARGNAPSRFPATQPEPVHVTFA